MTGFHDNKLNPLEYPGGRVMMIINYYNLNRNSFSIKIGMPSNSLITRITNNPAMGMSLELIQKIIKAFPEISCRWFVMGEGEMIIKQKEREECESCAIKDRLIETQQNTIASQNQLVEYYRKLCKK
jgi:hypothetical protein